MLLSDLSSLSTRMPIQALSVSFTTIYSLLDQCVSTASAQIEKEQKEERESVDEKVTKDECTHFEAPGSSSSLWSF